jgi:hypothetical protein
MVFLGRIHAPVHQVSGWPIFFVASSKSVPSLGSPAKLRSLRTSPNNPAHPVGIGPFRFAGSGMMCKIQASLNLPNYKE